MSVTSDENKEMLFSLFDDIQNENTIKLNTTEKNDLHIFISRQCEYLHNKRFEFENINEINKKIIDNSYNYYNKILDYKKNLLKNQQQQQSQNINLSIPTSLPVNKKESINKAFQQQKNDFESHIRPKQDEIDFTEPNKDEPISNLDFIMSQTLADREKELQAITQQYSQGKDAKKWLETTSTQDGEVEKLKIDSNSNVKLEIKPINKPKKKVTFQDDKPVDKFEMASFLSKLKKKTETTKKPNIIIKARVGEKPKVFESSVNQNQIILDKLNIIILNQENIFKQLNEIKNHYHQPK